MSSSYSASSSHSHFDTISEIVWKNLFRHRFLTRTIVKNITLMVVGSIAIWISAKIKIPFYPVPATLQTLVLLIVGMAYGRKLAIATVLLYLTQGAIGLPVFAGTPEKGIGLAYMIGPTGGYLIGFVFAVYLMGWLAEKGWDRSLIKTTLAMILGNLIIYTLGILGLGTLLGWDKPVFQWGLIPFIPGDIIKILIASILLPSIWKKLKKN